MLVHRARRTEVGEYVPEASPIVDFMGRPIIHTDTVPLLARDPGRSDVEVMLHRANALVLTEAARETLEGILRSSVRLAQEATGELLAVWRTRRDRPELLAQPAKQWPGGASSETTGFEGYRPGSREYNPGAIIAAPSWRKRITASALSDDLRDKWSAFD
jgi:hypothetical protein